MQNIIILILSELRIDKIGDILIMEEGDTLENKDIEWYNNPNIITNAAIGILILMIILSESFAVNSELSTVDILRNLLNHNSIYLLGLIYFVPLKTKTGKKYFNYLNLFLVIVYTILSLTSILTIIRSFGITSLINMAINIVILIYAVHTLFKNTKIWKEFKLELSPFNEINNDSYFYTIIILASILLMVNLISTVNFDGIVLSLVATTYYFALARYIYLYQVHLNHKNSKKKVKK